MAEEGTHIEGEEGSHDANPDQVAEAVRSKATDMGWRPLDQWDKDPADWVDAKEYVGRQSLFDKIKDLKGELSSQRRSFEKDMEAIKTHIHQMSEIEYQKAVRALKAERKVAIEDRDTDTVEQLDTQIQEVEKQRQTAPTKNTGAAEQAREVQQKFVEWRGKNKWYDADAEMRSEADSIGIGYGTKNPHASTEDIFAHVEKTMKKIYPEKLGGKAPVTEEKENKAPVVEGGRMTPSAGSGKSRTNTLSEGDLTAQQKTIMNALVKRGVLTKEQYISQLTDSIEGSHKNFREYQPKKQGA